MIIAIAELPIPNAVLIRASEIPFANATESGEPADARAENALSTVFVYCNAS